MIVSIAIVAGVAYAAIDTVRTSQKMPVSNPFDAFDPQPSTPLNTSGVSTEGLTAVDEGAAARNPPQPPPMPVAVAPGIILRNTSAELIAPFQIKTSAGANYFVKLVDVKSGKAIIGIYVIGGQTLDVNVPVGRYEMRYASGQIWYGTEHLFGPEPSTEYAKTDDIFDFAIQGDQVSGYTVELIRQVNGNLDTRQIDKSQF